MKKAVEKVMWYKGFRHHAKTNLNFHIFPSNLGSILNILIFRSYIFLSALNFKIFIFYFVRNGINMPFWSNMNLIFEKFYKFKNLIEGSCVYIYIWFAPVQERKLVIYLARQPNVKSLYSLRCLQAHKFPV